MLEGGSLSFPIPGSWATEKKMPGMPQWHKHKER